MPSSELHSYLTAAEIKRINAELGKRICSDYGTLLAEGEDLLVVVTLKGAMFFAADLIRELTVPLRVDFVRLASYGVGTKSSGNVRFLKDVECSPQGQHVLVLDEIVDSGRTLAFLVERLQATGPKTMRVCALLNKFSRREVPIHVDYVGRDVDDKFLVGYGLDHNERYRNLPDIYFL